MPSDVDPLFTQICEEIVAARDKLREEFRSAPEKGDEIEDRFLKLLAAHIALGCGKLHNIRQK